MRQYLPHLMKGAEIRTESFMALQEKNKSELQYGGISGDIWDAKPTIYALATAMSVYCCKESRFYRDKKLLEAMTMAVDFVMRTQRDDGFFDYPSCNFQSAPDTSFCFKRLIATYRLIKKYSFEELDDLSEKYLRILHKALTAIRKGGFHTPNHRWAISAALIQGANLFSSEESFAEDLRKRAQQYLDEGIDCDEDGEYAERSTGNYNAVVNNAMLALYEETGDSKYLDIVKRNLTMMLTYIDPDGTVFTQNSTRQDKGKKEYPDKYFYQYLFAAVYDNNAVFASAARKIIENNIARGDTAPDCFHIIMNHDEMKNYVFSDRAYLPETYRKFYKHPGVLRVATKNYTYTVMKGKSDFLYFTSGDTTIYVKVGESYCAIRNFIPQEIEAEGKETRLHSTAEGWYYQPFDIPPATSDWWEMDQNARKKLIMNRLDIDFHIHETDDGLEFSFDAKGLDRLPLRLEICIPAGATICHDCFQLITAPGQSMILKSGNILIKDKEKKIEIGPGFGEHSFKGHYSGEEINSDGYTVYCNAYTPTERHFSIKVR